MIDRASAIRLNVDAATLAPQSERHSPLRVADRAGAIATFQQQPLKALSVSVDSSSKHQASVIEASTTNISGDPRRSTHGSSVR